MRGAVRAVIFIMAFAGAAVALAAEAPSLTPKQKLFQDAYRTLRSGGGVDMAVVRRKLHGYLLEPYIEYRHLANHLDSASAATVRRFLKRYAAYPFSGLIRRAWLLSLAKRHRWSTFLAEYKNGGDAELACDRLVALQSTRGIDKAWIKEAFSLWDVGYLQPKACSDVFKALYRRKAVSAKQVWARIDKSVGNGYLELARFLGEQLPNGKDRRWVDTWIDAYRKPDDVLARLRGTSPSHRARQVVRTALVRLADDDPKKARAYLHAYVKSGLYSPRDGAALEKRIDLIAAASLNSKALAWLDELPPELMDSHVRHWQARLALVGEDWKRLLGLLERLPASVTGTMKWRYWRAYALERTGETDRANHMFESLAKARNYYGFLAADQLKLPYHMNQDSVAFDPRQLATVARIPAIRRAKELWLLGFTPEARREWREGLSGLDRQGLAKAAALARTWGWYDRAVTTANEAGLHNALGLRFPTPYRNAVERYSKANDLDPAVTYAMLRKESAFMPDAQSGSGALGLMQVMPGTGRRVARSLKEHLGSRHALLDVDTNLRLGAAYLREVLDRFSDNLVLAAAAYNAGPNRVDQWIDKFGGRPPALWVETITYSETRDYVKSILAFSTVFDWRLTGKTERLSSRMGPIPDDADGLAVVNKARR